MKSKNKGNTAKTTLAAELPQSNNSLKKFYYIFGLIAFILYANTIANDYNMDDSMVTKNHKLTSQGLSAIGEIFTSPYYSDDAGYAYGYRPMVHLSFALEHDIFGEKPGSGHFINVILFAFSVILFFKLLLKWVGEKNLLFAGIATLLFAVHPIHTEVVASLKNRDEILAFLFVLWSGLAATKFIDKGKWISLVGILILFVLAMLSKKSVFPMAIVLPLGIILTKDLSVKQLVLLILAFVVPAALIGSDFQLGQGIIMAVIPSVLILFVYLLKRVLLVENKQMTILNNWIIPLFAIAALLGVSIFADTFWLLFFTIPFFLWLHIINFQLGILSLILVLITSDAFLIDLKELRILAIFLTIGYAIHLFIEKNKAYKKWSLLALILLVYTFLKSNELATMLLILIVSLIIVATFKNIWLGLTLSTIALITSLFVINKVEFFATIVFLFNILWLIKQKVKNFWWLSIAPVFAFAAMMIFLLYKEDGYAFNKATITNEQVNENNKPNNQLPNAQDPKLKEGRQLEFVENTLVAPHTTAQFVATGFATLYEYARLHIFPKELSFYYGYSKTKTEDFSAPIVWISILFHLALIILALLQIKKRPIITIGVAWYLLCILLFSNWIELVAGMVGERLAFTASAGFCMLIAGIIMWIKPDLKLSNPGVVGYILIGCMVLFAGRTFVRNKDWKDNITLMSKDIQHLQNSAQANNLYAMALMTNSVQNPKLTQLERADYQKRGVEHFEKAIEIWPNFYNAHIDIARASTLTKDYKKGIYYLNKAIKIDPKNVLTYYTLLELTEYSGDYPGYLETAQEVFKMIQNDHAYGYVARGYFLTKQFEKSKETLLEGLKVYPESDLLKNNLGFLKQQGYIN